MRTVFILIFLYFCQSSYSLHCLTQEGRFIGLNDDNAQLILAQLSVNDWRSCRLVCWSWRAQIDFILEEYFKIKKAQPSSNPIEENDFARLIYINGGYKHLQDGESKDAFHAFQKASLIKPGNCLATYMVGSLFLRGEGVDLSVREGIYQLQKAAAAGYPSAMVDLGLFFLTGSLEDRDGFQVKHPEYQDHRLAFIFFEQGRKLDNAKCLYHLGKMYYEGLYVKRDVSQGIQLIQQAAAKKYDLAIKTLDTLVEEP